MLSSDSDGPNDNFSKFTSPPMLLEANIGRVELLVGGGGNAIAVSNGNFLEQQKDDVLEGGEDVRECPKTIPTEEDKGCLIGRPEAFWRAKRAGRRAALSITPFMYQTDYCR